jgi:hypothetical protein
MRKSQRRLSFLSSCMALIALCGCSKPFVIVDVPANPTYGKATVLGSDAHVSRFQKELSISVPQLTTDAGSDHFNCVEGDAPLRCEKAPGTLLDGKKRISFTFIREYRYGFSHLTTAWHKVQVALGGSETEFLISFTNHGVNPSCVNSGPGCQPNPFCGDGCGKPCPACF